MAVTGQVRQTQTMSPAEPSGGESGVSQEASGGMDLSGGGDEGARGQSQGPMSELDPTGAAVPQKSPASRGKILAYCLRVYLGSKPWLGNVLEGE